MVRKYRYALGLLVRNIGEKPVGITAGVNSIKKKKNFHHIAVKNKFKHIRK